MELLSMKVRLTSYHPLCEVQLKVDVETGILHVINVLFVALTTFCVVWLYTTHICVGFCANESVTVWSLYSIHFLNYL